MKKIGLSLAVAFSLAFAAPFVAPVYAHHAYTDKNGCHVDHSTGERHCHEVFLPPKKKKGSKKKKSSEVEIVKSIDVAEFVPAGD